MPVKIELNNLFLRRQLALDIFFSSCLLIYIAYAAVHLYVETSQIKYISLLFQRFNPLLGTLVVLARAAHVSVEAVLSVVQGRPAALVCSVLSFGAITFATYYVKTQNIFANGFFHSLISVTSLILHQTAILLLRSRDTLVFVSLVVLLVPAEITLALTYISVRDDLIKNEIAAVIEYFILIMLLTGHFRAAVVILRKTMHYAPVGAMPRIPEEKNWLIGGT